MVWSLTLYSLDKGVKLLVQLLIAVFILLVLGGAAYLTYKVLRHDMDHDGLP